MVRKTKISRLPKVKYGPLDHALYKSATEASCRSVHVSSSDTSKGSRICPRCGSSDLGPKGTVKSRLGNIPLLRCRKCNYRFRSVRVREISEIVYPEDLLDRYLHCTSLQGLTSIMGMKVSKSTLHRKIKQKLLSVPGWRDLIDERLQKVGRIMGIDTTSIKIGGKSYAYLHIADISSKTNLVYEILPNEKAESIMPILYFLKARGYYPAVTITDLAEELLKSTGTVYPQTIIQGCLFHLRYLLDKKLPTKRAKHAQRKRNPNNEMLRKTWLWDKAKSIMMAIAVSEKDKREELCERLKSLPLDKRAKETVEDFLTNLIYYHPPSKLHAYGCTRNLLYNNFVERCMGQIERLKNKVRGFKRLHTTQKLIDAVWKDEQRSAEEGEELKTFIELTLDSYNDVLRLRDVEELMDVSSATCTRALQKAGYTVAKEYAFSNSFIVRARKTLENYKPKTLAEAAECLGINADIAADLLRELGFNMLYLTLDHRDIIINY